MDDLLLHLRHQPMPEVLGKLDDAVLSAFAAQQREQATAPRLIAVATLFALGTGLVAGSVTSAPAVAAPLSPFASNSVLAPSTLLDPR